MVNSVSQRQSEFRSSIRTGLAALCVTTALCSPTLCTQAFAGGKGGISISVGSTVGGIGGAVGGIGGSIGGIGGSVGGIGGSVGGISGGVGGVGGAVGGIGGSVGGISSGGGGVGGAVGGITGGSSSGGGSGISIGGVIGHGSGVGSSSPHFTGSNFFSGGTDFSGGGSRSVNSILGGGQRVRHRNSSVATRGLKTKSNKLVAQAGQGSIKAQNAAKNIAPESVTSSRIINLGGAQGVTAKINPDQTARPAGS